MLNIKRILNSTHFLSFEYVLYSGKTTSTKIKTNE